LNYADANAEFKKGKSQFLALISWISKWNAASFMGQKITTAEFYAAAKKVLKY